MNYSECGVRLHVTEEDDQVVLRFAQVTMGFEGFLCMIRKKTGLPLFEVGKIAPPDRLTRAAFWLIYGLKGFRPECSVRSDECEQERISFFKCSDRRGRSRTFVFATQSPGLEAGGCFLAVEQDFDEIMRSLKQLESIWR